MDVAADAKHMRGFRRRFSITSLFTGATLVPLMAVGVLLLYLAVRTTNQVSASLGEQVMAQAARRVQDSVRSYLQVAERTSDVYADLLLMGAMPSEDLSRWHVPMLTSLRTRPEVASIGFANAADDYVYLMRFPPELEYGIGVGSRDGTTMDATTAYLDGRPGETARPPRTFNVRDRPWHQAAMATKGPVWTPAYTWFDKTMRPKNLEFSVAYTRALYEPKTGQFIGVLSVDTLLTQVNTTLHDLSEPLQAFLVVTDGDGFLIGSSDLGPGVATLPPERRMRDIDNPVARALAREISNHDTAALRTAAPTHIDVDGQTYWATQSALALGPGTQWFVTVAIPERSILTDAKTSIRWIVTIGTAYLSFAAIVSVVLARLLTRPLRRLAVFARKIGDGHFDERVDIATTSELADLSAALNGMALSLDDRIHLLAQRDAAEQATAVKSRLIAHMSHEFRTPLNAIINYAELLRDSAAAEGCLRDANDATNIVTASHHLLSLVENLLDLSMIEAGRLRLETCVFSIEGLINEVATTARPIVERERNRLHINPLASIAATMTSDPTRVRQILINLLSNAGKFTRDGDVTLRAAIDEPSRTISFEVIDTGPGIASDKIGRLFEPFMHVGGRGPTTIVSGAGAGLGLAISRQLARSLGGDIAVDTGPSGTRMAVTLPLDGPPPPDQSSALV